MVTSIQNLAHDDLCNGKFNPTFGQKPTAYFFGKISIARHLQPQIPEVGTPRTVISDHGTQFKGRLWKETRLKEGIRTYKTSVYHPTSSLAERVLREVGRLLRTYCHQNHKEWNKYLSYTEESINITYHDSIGTTPFQAMYNQPTPRLITEIISFPNQTDDKPLNVNIRSKLIHKAKLRKKRQQRLNKIAKPFQVNDLVLVRNHQIPSTLEGLMRKLLLIYIGPFLVSQVNENNTYKIIDPINKKGKGVYNQNQLKLYYQRTD